jgi:hypothetical protein
MLLLPERWQDFLRKTGETGMGYQTGNIILKNGTVFHDVVFMNPYLGEIRGRAKGDVPFQVSDIAKIELTHNRWKWAW